MNGAVENRRLVARILLFSAILFLGLAALSLAGVLPIDPAVRRLFAISFGLCAAADGLIGAILWSRSHTS